MRLLMMVLIAGLVAFSFSQCKKSDDHKLENPFGLLQLGSDTSLADGRYVLRIADGCSGYFNALKCDNADEVLTMNYLLTPTDHIVSADIDSLAVWYVKKVRYVSPDPDYALAFGYRIYQYRPNGLGYRFLSFTSMATPGTDNYDEVGDGGGQSIKVVILQRENYPRDPDVPTEFQTSNLPEEPDTRYLFQFYESKDNPGYRLVKAGGRFESTGTPPVNRWKLCTGYWEEENCDGNALPLHFRSEFDGCKEVDPNSGATRRCYIDEFVFAKVYN